MTLLPLPALYDVPFRRHERRRSASFTPSSIPITFCSGFCARTSATHGSFSAGSRSTPVRCVLEERAPPANPGAGQLSELPYTTGAKQALEQAVVACRELEHAHLGTGHLVLALLRAERGMAAESLREAGVTAEAIVEYLSPTGSREPSSEPSPRRPVAVTVTVEHRDGTTSTETFPGAFATVRYLFDLSRDTEANL